MIHIKVTAKHAGEVAEKFWQVSRRENHGRRIQNHEPHSETAGEVPTRTTAPALPPHGRLGNAWTVTTRLTGNGATLNASNDTPYVKWVQDKPSQAWMHQGAGTRRKTSWPRKRQRLRRASGGGRRRALK